MKYIYSENNLTIGYKRITFDYIIGKIVELNNLLIVLVSPPPSVIYNENVFAINYEGDILWRIEQYDFIETDSPYTDISTKDNILYLYNWMGYSVTVESYTGKIIKVDFVK